MKWLKVGPSAADLVGVRLRGTAALLARVRARANPPHGGDVLRFADLELEPERRQVRRQGRELELTPTEFALLELFLRNPERVLAHEEIFRKVWGFDFGPRSNLLHVYVGYLRRKTEAEGGERLVHSVRGVGFVLRRPS
jgi:two-component system response regulator MprA